MLSFPLSWQTSFFPAARADHENTVLQREIDDSDKQIEQLVYELYGLTDDEIKIVEEERAG